MKLELKHLAGYLPYGLKGNYLLSDVVPTKKDELRDKLMTSDNIKFFLDYATPILRPLSDLTNDDTIAIHELCTIDLELINIEEWTEELIHEIKTGQKFKLKQFEYLFSKHFDIYGLIENNLAIDINTLK